MLGFIKKEFLCFLYSHNPMSFVGDIATFFICLLLGNNIGLVTYVLVIMPMAASSVPVTLFEADGKANFNRYAIALPLKKLQIVGSRFLFQLIFIAFYTCLMFLFAALYAAIHGSFSFSDYMMITYTGVLMMLMISFVNLAGSYILGFQGGALIMSFFYFLIVGCTALFALLGKNGSFDFLSYLITHPDFIWILLTLAAFIISVFAFAIACFAFQWKHR